MPRSNSGGPVHVVCPVKLVDSDTVATKSGASAVLDRTQILHIFAGVLSGKMKHKEAASLIKGKQAWPPGLAREERERIARAEAARRLEEADETDPIPNPKFRRLLSAIGWDEADEWFGARPLNESQQLYLRDQLYPKHLNKAKSRREHFAKIRAMSHGYIPFPPEVEERERRVAKKISEGKLPDSFKP